jgi:hypothetical protein
VEVGRCDSQALSAVKSLLSDDAHTTKTESLQTKIPAAQR